MKSKLLAVFGNPILHSKSPLMFNALLGDSGLYTRIRVQSGKDVAEAARHLNLAGANITAPFKKEVLPFVDEQSEEVSLIGGANTLVNNSGRLTAYNTDWYGATQAIKQSGLSLKGLKVVLLGLGGAGKAVAYGLVKEGADVTLVNRTASKAVEISRKLGCRMGRLEELPILIADAELFISVLSPSAKIPINHLPKGLWVFDANYHASALVEVAKKNGNPIVDGSQWLLHQAVKAYEHIFGTTPSVEVMNQALKQPRSTSIKAVAICNVDEPQQISEEFWAAPRANAESIINLHQPDLVIYTPTLGTNEVEEIYKDERSKAFGS